MVYVLLADGFEEMEALTPVDLLRRAGVEVATVALHGQRATGAHGITVEADLTFEALLKERCELLVLPGGKGYALLDGDARVEALLKELIGTGTPVGAICAAPTILGKRGYLDGLPATCFPSMEGEMGGALLKTEPAVRAGQFVTGRAAGVATQFALALIALLRGEEQAERIREEICFGDA